MRPVWAEMNNEIYTAVYYYLDLALKGDKHDY